MKTVWESIPRKLVGRNCPECKLRWEQKPFPKYCPNCGRHTKFIIQYNIPTKLWESHINKREGEIK